MAHRPVVAAAILDSLEAPTRLLCAARAYPPALAGRFELPGGKVEPGETPEEALAREIAEELSTRLRLGAPVPRPAGAPSSRSDPARNARGASLVEGLRREEPPADDPDRWWPILEGRRMAVWLAEVDGGAGAPRPGTSHRELRWVPLGDVESLDWIGADLPIVREVVHTALSSSPTVEAGSA